MYEQRSERVLFRYKFLRKVLEQKLNKIKFVIGFGDLVDIYFIRAVLMKKALVKKLFVLDVEHGQEVYIPDLLSCDLYPRSFRYYDPIISITNRMFSAKSRVYHALRTDHNLRKNRS